LIETNALPLNHTTTEVGSSVDYTTDCFARGGSLEYGLGQKNNERQWWNL